MAADLTWPGLTRPAPPLLYLDLNHFVYLARARHGRVGGPAGYSDLLASLQLAIAEGRVVVPLSAQHVFEMQGIADPKQRQSVLGVMEQLSGFQYLIGSPSLAELEIDAGIRDCFSEPYEALPLPLIRPTFAHAFGLVGGFKVFDGDGKDTSESVRQELGPAAFDAIMGTALWMLERSVLGGPATDAEAAELRAKYGYQPEKTREGQESRLAFELDTSTTLSAHSRWRRGRLRDLISAREFVHEWLDIFNRVMAERAHESLPCIDPASPEMHRLLASMPHMQVAISLKTHLHRNPSHRWTVNDVADIDAIAVGYAYCDAIFTDKAMRHALASAPELRTIPTFLPRSPGALREWVDALPTPPLGSDFLVGVGRKANPT